MLAPRPDACLAKCLCRGVAMTLVDRERAVPADPVVPVRRAQLAREEPLDEDQVVAQVHAVRQRAAAPAGHFFVEELDVLEPRDAVASREDAEAQIVLFRLAEELGGESADA